MDITLLYPLEFGKITVSKLVMRDYSTAEDYLSFDAKGGVAQNLALVASMSGQDEAVIRKLRGPDYQRAVKHCNDIIDHDAVEAFPPAKTPDDSSSDATAAAEKK